ncbi:metal-dependent hydrolase [Kroppenstedtia eburnea]|uniref:metal-dependent hydrolase n=1 Tax=Kroppenstedtia eburnea TaxID=714067 RepID=UPI0036324189
MTGKTHAALGMASGVVATWATGAEGVDVVWTMVVSTVAALFPDIDEPSSKINQVLFGSFPRKVRPLTLSLVAMALVIGVFIWEGPLWLTLFSLFLVGVSFASHRGMTHSLFALAFMTGVAYLAFPDYVWAVSLGYGSHLIADAMTIQGIPLWWPSKRPLGLRLLGIRIRTGQGLDRFTGWSGLVWLFA